MIKITLIMIEDPINQIKIYFHQNILKIIYQLFINIIVFTNYLLTLLFFNELN